MKNEHTLSGLMRKRTELSALLEEHDAASRQLRIDIDALDMAIRLFDPDIDLPEVKPRPLPPRHAAYKGEVARIVLGSLREAGAPMSIYDLTLHVMADRNMNTADRRLVKTVMKRVGSCCRHYRNKGTIRSNRLGNESGRPIVWEIAN